MNLRANLLASTTSDGGAGCSGEAGSGALEACAREPPCPRSAPHRAGRGVHGARRRRSLRLGDLPQLHERHRRLADGDWVGFDNYTSAWHDENFRRALRNTLVFTLASQAIVLVGAAVLSNFSSATSVAMDRALPRGAAGRRRSSSRPSPGVAPRLPVQRGQLDARVAQPTTASSGCLAPCTSRKTRRCRCSGSVARTRARRDHARARLADPPVRRRDLHRRPRVHPERGRGRREDRRGDRREEAVVCRRPAPAPDRTRSGPLRDRLHRSRLRGRLHPHAWRAFQLRRRCCPRGPTSSESTPVP